MGGGGGLMPPHLSDCFVNKFGPRPFILRPYYFWWVYKPGLHQGLTKFYPVYLNGFYERPANGKYMVKLTRYAYRGDRK